MGELIAQTHKKKNESTCKLYAQITFFMRQKIAVNSIDIEQKNILYTHPFSNHAFFT